MASASSSTSQLNLTSYYDVFLSFRGEDTRNSFTDHLFEALMRAGVSTFRDNDNIDCGRELKPEIERAIIESRASIVVLSEQYANSRWCLDELVLILERRRSVKHIVLPVFYHVDPSDVRNQRKSFAINVDGVEGSKWTAFNVNRWKAALTEVANSKGVVVSGPETSIIADIVATIKSKLNLKLVRTPAHLVGMDTRAIGIKSWLENEESGDNVLAICGMGGCGKTTLSQFIYNSNKQKFERSSYLEEIGKHNKEPHGMLELQRQLLSDILGEKNIRISKFSSEYTSKIEDALQMKRVLLVLDDIDDPDELEALLGIKVLHPQSKILITTRLLDIDAWFRSIFRRCQVQEPDLLNDDESLELLSFHAFGSKIPMEGFMELAVQLSQYCGGNPLALKVLGSSIFVKVEERSNMIETWRSLLNPLNLLKGDLDDRIQGILQKSFDSLPQASYRELFLHIAFFFVGENEDFAVKILEYDWHAKAGITTLINRCLLTVSPSKKLMMHQLLQEMAKSIVLKENKDPAKRSRVSQKDESLRLLTKEEGSETIEGLELVLDYDTEMKEQPSVINTASLAKMDKLKLLKLQNVKLTGSYKHFPELRWLKWFYCPLKTIPSGLFGSSLVVINMTGGSFKKFEPPMVLKTLKILDLTLCTELVSIRNLSRLPNLESLNLRGCNNLTHVCETIGGLKSLALLDLTMCRSLLKVSLKKKLMYQLQRVTGEIPQQSLISLPESVEFLLLKGLPLFENSDVPVVFSGQQKRFYMNLSYNGFEVIPNKINLKGLRVLELSYCSKLESLLCLPSTLEKLYTYFSFKLKKITFDSRRYRLQDFGYRGCRKLSEVQGLFKLAYVENLNEADLGHMKWIKSYQDHEVDLVGDEITKNRNGHIQVLYEYGIMSTYLPAIISPFIPATEYISTSPLLSFQVPCHQNRTIQGLYVISSYRSSGTDVDAWVLFTKISNTTKGLTWMYNPVVYCQPGVGEDAIWISYWPNGNILDIGDEVNVSIIAGNGLIVSWCGANLVYMDDGEVRQNYTKEEEVIGGDLSEFELTTGGYYLCRRDFFKSTTPDWLRMLPHKELQGWRKARQTRSRLESLKELDPLILYSYETLDYKIALWRKTLGIIL